MTINYRALCAELLAWAERTSAHYVAPPDVIVRARAALAQSVPEGPTDEELYDVAEQFNGDPVPAMRRALELWGRPAVEPVPVAMRLPEPEDRDAKGRCWWLSQPARYAPTWVLQRPRGSLLSPFIAWAPHWALPLPEEGE